MNPTHFVARMLNEIFRFLNIRVMIIESAVQMRPPSSPLMGRLETHSKLFSEEQKKIIGENGGDEEEELPKENIFLAIIRYVIFAAIVALIISFIVLLSLAYIKQVFYGDSLHAGELYLPIIKLLREIHPNWTILLVIPLILFYHPIYQFLLRAKKLWPPEREDLGKPSKPKTGKKKP